MKKIFLIVLLTVLFGTPKSSAQEPYIGQIAMAGYNFAPPGWLMCQGQLLPISQYTTLYVLIGTTYGGDGQTTFALPDYRGRVLVGVGQGPGLTNKILGANSGQENVTLTVANLPAHTHTVNASTNAGTTSVPTNNFLANTGALDNEYSNVSNTSTGPTSTAGLSQPLYTTQPYLGINYMIAYEGIFPTQ